MKIIESESTTIIEMRPLLTEDVFTVVNMLRKLSKGDLPKLMVSVDKMVNEKETGLKDYFDVGQLVINALYESLEKEFLAWLASIVNMSREKLMKTPIDTIPDLIETILESEKYKSFFLRVSKLYKMIPDKGKNTKKK